MLRRSLITLVCLSGLALAGCGSEAPPAAPTTPASELSAPAAITASRSATESESDLTATGTIGYDDSASKYVLRRGGPKSEATVGQGKSQFQVITVPGFVFVKAPASVWKDYVTDRQAAQLDNRWTVSVDQGPLKDFTQFTNVTRFFRTSGNIRKGKPTEVNGQQAVTLIDPPISTNSTWWVAANGSPLLLKTQSGDFTRVAFDYEAVNIVDLPKEGEVIDFTLVLENRVPTATLGP